MKSATWMVWGAVVALTGLILTGCWDQHSLTDRASAMLLKVTWQPGFRPWQWTFYFPNPTVTISSLSQIPKGQQAYAISVKAPSLTSAYTAADERLTRDLYLGQLQDVIWSSNMPATAVAWMIDAYNREGLTPKTAYVAAVADSFDPIASSYPEVITPSIYISNLFSCTGCHAVRWVEPLWQLWDAFQTVGVSPVVPYVDKTGNIRQIAVYGRRGPPLLFSAAATRGWAYLTGRVVKLNLTFRMRVGTVSVTRVEAHTHAQIAWRGGALLVKATIHATGALSQWPVHQPLKVGQVQAVEAVASRQIVQNCLAAVTEANQSHTDPFGWGRSFVFSHPDELGAFQREGARAGIDAHITASLRLENVGVGS